MLQLTLSILSRCATVALLVASSIRLQAQPYTPVDLGDFNNVSLNVAENIAGLTATSQGPNVYVSANFQGGVINNNYQINPVDNSRSLIPKGLVRYNTPASFEQNETSAVPSTSSGLAYAGSENGQAKFINLNTGAFSFISHQPSANLALCAPFAINGKILISIILPNSNRRAILSTDGTEAGSVVLPFTSSPAGTIFHYRSKGNGTLYISAEVTNSLVWVTDGTSAGTKLLLNGRSPNPDMQSFSLGISGDEVCYQSASRKIFRINGDSTNRTEISVPFPPLQFPQSFFGKFDFTPVERTGTLLITYSHSALLSGGFEQGLGMISPGSSSFTRIKTLPANAPLKTPKYAVPLASGGGLMVFDKHLVRTNYALNQTDTLRLTDLGYDANETNVRYHAFDGRLFLTHAQNFQPFGKVSITDGTIAGTQLMNAGGTSATCTVDEAGIAWYAIDRNLFRINGTPFTQTKKSVSQPVLTIFPNPARHLVRVAMPEVTGKMTIVGATGSVHEIPQPDNGELDISTLSPGLYFLKTSSGATCKLVVE